MKKTLFILCALLLTAVGASAQITSGGTYMLQNVETEYFLGGGGSWGTQAVTLARPQQFTIESSGTGYTLHSYQGSATGGYLTSNLYVDTGTSEVWTIEEGTGDNAGTYTISLSGSGYLSANNATAEDVAIVFSPTEEYWRIISPDDIKEKMKSATADEPVDVTGLIMNPTLNAKSNGTSAGSDLWGYWSVTGYNTDDQPSNFAFAQHDESTCARVVETYHSTDGFDIRQTITGLPAGLYKFTAQGFYRDDSEASDVKPVIYVEPEWNTYEVTLKNLDSSDDGKAVVNATTAGMATAYNAFLAGYYPNEVEFIMSAEGDATIGFRSDLTTNDNIWTIFGEINLYYYGEVVDDDCDYTEGTEIEKNNFKGTVASGNLFKNGGFNNGVVGWNAGNGYTAALAEANVTLTSTGGYNDGPFITSKGGGSGADTTPSQAVAITSGKTYLFVGYTKGTAPTDNNKKYNGLMQMTAATTEASSGNDPIEYVAMKWGDGEEELNGWTKTEAVFTATTNYAGVRFAWCPDASFDGIQLYELEELPSSVEWVMTDANWGTLILPFAADIPTTTDEEETATLAFYAGSAISLGETDADGNTALTLGTAAGSIAANTPYLVSGTAGTYTFTGTPVAAETLTSGMLTGTFVDMTYSDFTLDGTQYLLQNHEGDVAFYPVVETQSEGATLTPYHCYLTSSVAPTAVHLPGMATAIKAIEGAEAEANGAIYDLSGRRVSKAVKGVYIQNGKKVLVK